MSNKRNIIRKAFADFLMNKTPAADRVFEGRVRTLEKTELPAINVRDEDEEANVANVYPRRYRRSLDIVIEISCETKQNIHEQLGLLMAGVENLIDTQDRFSPLEQHVCEIFYKGSKMYPQLGDKTQVSGVGHLIYQVTYDTYAGALADEAPEYEQIFADFNAGQAQTEFTIEQ